MKLFVCFLNKGIEEGLNCSVSPSCWPSDSRNWKSLHTMGEHLNKMSFCMEASLDERERLIVCS